jgi:hypothetical protein
MQAVPARAGITARKNATQRPKKTAAPPWRAKKSWDRPDVYVACGGCAGSGSGHLAANLVPDAVADDRRNDDDRDHRSQRGVAEARGDAAEDGRSLPGNHEPDEKCVLDEDQQGDQGQNRPGGGVQVGAFRIWLTSPVMGGTTTCRYGPRYRRKPPCRRRTP